MITDTNTYRQTDRQTTTNKTNKQTKTKNNYNYYNNKQARTEETTN